MMNKTVQEITHQNYNSIIVRKGKIMKLTGSIPEQVKEIENICKQYGFLDETVMPYGVPVKVFDLIENWKGYANCTTSSKEIITDEIVGFVKILDKWVEHANEPMVQVRIIQGPKKGTVASYRKSIATAFVNDKLAELV